MNFKRISFILCLDISHKRLEDVISQTSEPIHINPGQMLGPGQVDDPGVNYASGGSVYGLTSVIVRMSF